ncbi:hypothetical protein WP8S18E04_36610 [Aeromonas caviae]|uniref:hypothetical protein n=1 Tax=Aeromonas caviae TaxID=648 RepID=UPI0015DD4DCC|nr:hypothetical protein [Aeromonas caviae]BBT68277.1 hypothetical protein WP8S18E04_36610 [Aeromonas caviae]
MIYSSSRIQQQMRLVNIEYLIHMINMGRLEPAPVIGNLPNRSLTKKSQIVESLILGLPENVIWAEQNPLGKTQLMSGFDIISSIVEFEQGQFNLRNLKILRHLEGLKFSDLDYAETRLFMQMEVILASISYDSDPMLRCLFVESINRGSYGSDAAQIARNIIFKDAAFQVERYSNTLANNLQFYDTIQENGSINKIKLTLQSAILYYLLFLYIKEYRINSYTYHHFSFESYSYSRSHVSSYADLNNVEINTYDSIELAINKIMFMIEVGHNKIMNAISSLEQEIDSCNFKKNIDTNEKNQSFKFSYLADFLSPLLSHGKSAFYRGRCKTVEALSSRAH